jgi:hypothetical protein
LGLVLVGAAAVAVATFLPFDEPTGPFSVVRQNTLIQLGSWWFLVLAIAIAVTAYRASQLRRGEWVVPIIFSALAVIAIVVLFNDEDLRTLYPIGANGTPETSAPGTVATLGVAIYVAGAGVAAAFIGSVLLRPSPYDDVPDEFVERAQEESATKKCPDLRRPCSPTPGCASIVGTALPRQKMASPFI